MLIKFESDIRIKSYNQKVFLCDLKKYLKRRSFEAEGRYVSLDFRLGLGVNWLFSFENLELFADRQMM